MEQRAMELGLTVLALALLLRLGSAPGRAAREVGTALAFLSTGRIVTETESTAQTEPSQPEPATEAATEPEAVPVFGESQEALVKVNAAWSVDTGSLLEAPLEWDLKGEKPTVLILHTHATESYGDTSGYRSEDPEKNMVSVGAALAETLEAGGIRVIHDRAMHDSPSYNLAYGDARESTAKYLEENPEICLVLDLHRDAAQDGNGKQKAASVTVNGVSAARLMLVMGSDRGSLSFPHWEKNLSLAVKLQAWLEQAYPGLCKPIKVVTSRYNQDLCPGALLVEVGMAGNTHEEALASAKLLAEGILALAKGANH